MKLAQVLILSVFTALVSCNQNTASDRKPNMVFILADDCSYWDLGVYGSKDAITPNIDQLAAEGIKFDKAYQAAPMCSPTRHNLYTGLYPVKTGAYPNHTTAKAGTKSIVQYLKPLGYRVALAGKSHVSPKEVFPFEYLKGLKDGDFSPIREFVKNADSKDEPFCLFVCSKQPHTPWDKGDPSLFPPKALSLPAFFVDTQDTRENYSNYLAEINYLDGQVGEVMSILKENGQDDNTLVIFSSEQGNSFPFAKWTCYDVGVRSAFIAKWPGKIKPASVSNAMIEYSDVVPTFVEIAGGTPVQNLDGKSLVNLFLGKASHHKDYSYSLQTTRGINNGSEHYGIRSIVSDRYRYILNLTPGVAFKNNITHKETWWKTWQSVAENDEKAASLVKKYQHRPQHELYDVIEDPYCMNNLAEIPEFEDIKNTLHSKLLAWMDECGDKGQQTEMEAKLHMPKFIKQAKSKNQN
ncbi:MAG: sulfatase [Cyclobacteriaceae bacterium]